ncbi:DUF1661 domain-containing protein [Porphyromonas sp. COT-052 OH4946]|nr:DUF1661 domain-containing protein [Porphyromonas sp. COT-052 OH4946]
MWEVNFLRAKTKTFPRVFSRKDEPQFVHFRFRKTFSKRSLAIFVVNIK